MPIELAVALFLLYRQIGLAFVAPAGVAILSASGIFFIAKYIGNAQKIWIEAIQSRVAATAVMLGSMKVSVTRPPSLHMLIISRVSKCLDLQTKCQ